MKIIITESQYNLIKEAVGVPENIIEEGKRLFDIVKNQLKKIRSTKSDYTFNDINIDLTISDIKLTHLNLIVNVEVLDSYDGTEALIASMGVGNEFDFYRVSVYVTHMGKVHKKLITKRYSKKLFFCIIFA